MVRGAQIDDAFQISLRRYPEDPLNVAVFAGLEALCIPQVGAYGEHYDPLQNLVVMDLPGDAFIRQLPPYVAEHLATLRTEPECYLIVHDAPDEQVFCGARE